MEERDKARGAKERAEIFAEQCAALEAQGFVPHDRSTGMLAANVYGTLAALPFIAAVIAAFDIGGSGSVIGRARMSARVVLGGGQWRRSQTGLRPTHFHAVLCSAQTYGKSALSHWYNRTFRVFRRRLFRCRMPYGALDAVRGRRGKRPDGGGGHIGRGTYRVFARQVFRRSSVTVRLYSLCASRTLRIKCRS